MKYKGYSAKVEFDPELGVFHGEVENITDVITFQGVSVSELEQEFHNSVDDYLDFCAEEGREPERPYSGRFVVRMPPDLHRDIAVAAELLGESMNSWIVRTCEIAIKSRSRSHQGTPWFDEDMIARALRGMVQDFASERKRRLGEVEQTGSWLAQEGSGFRAPSSWGVGRIPTEASRDLNVKA